MQLRSYQQSIHNQLISTKADCVYQLDTGGGKTPIIAELNKQPTINIAHRNFLIEQISQTLTKQGIAHKIIGTSAIVNRCKLFQRDHGLSESVCKQSDVYVGTIQSIASRHRNGKLGIDTAIPFQIIIDECHHVADGNMWAKLRDVFPHARFIGATATPCRLDGRGLHKSCGGLFDELIQADELKENSVKWLIQHGYLADYRAFCPKLLDMSMFAAKVRKKNASDYTHNEISSWEYESITLPVIGDVINHYKNLADNKITLVYCASIDTAKSISEMFKKHGYSATYIASTLSFVENMRRIDAFRAGDVQILINVEMATEGFDLPSAECLIILRPTASLVLHRQMIGRVLRPKENGEKAIIIDHVGNILEHGLPDDEIFWTLTGTPKNKSERVIMCEECGSYHNVFLKYCPNCGEKNWLRSTQHEGVRAVRMGFIQVELVEQLRKEIKRFDTAEAARIEREKKEQQLKTEIVVPTYFHTYSNGAVGNLYKKLSYWFLENIQKTDIPIADINKFLHSRIDFSDFWLDNFTIKDLNTNNTQKCEKVLKKWLKSR